MNEYVIHAVTEPDTCRGHTRSPRGRRSPASLPHNVIVILGRGVLANAMLVSPRISRSRRPARVVYVLPPQWGGSTGSESKENRSPLTWHGIVLRSAVKAAVDAGGVRRLRSDQGL